MVVDAEDLRDRRSGNIGIQDSGLIAEPACLDGEQAGHQGFSHAAFSADNTDHFFDTLCIVDGTFVLFFFLTSAAGGAGTAFMIAICHDFLRSFLMIVRLGGTTLLYHILRFLASHYGKQ